MIINCPNCNGYISSRASKCVHCGAEFPHYCEECNALLNKGDVVCSNCGCPAYVNFSEQNKSKKGLIGLIVGLIILIGLGTVGYLSYTKYDNNRQFLASFYEVISVIAVSATEVEEVGLKIDKVWRNSIIENTTKAISNPLDFDSNLANIQEGVSVDLSKLNDDSDYVTKIEKIENDQIKVMKIMRELKKPSEDKINMYDDLRKFYDIYLNFSNTVLFTTGKSLNSYTEDFKKYQSEMVSNTLKLKQYLAE